MLGRKKKKVDFTIDQTITSKVKVEQTGLSDRLTSIERELTTIRDKMTTDKQQIQQQIHDKG